MDFGLKLTFLELRNMVAQKRELIIEEVHTEKSAIQLVELHFILEVHIIILISLISFNELT